MGNSKRLALPAWISAIGRTGFVPLHVQRSLDCQRTVYQRADDDWPLQRLCNGGSGRTPAWRAFETARTMKLHVDRDVTPPRLWHFVLAMLTLLTWLDRVNLRKTENGLVQFSHGLPEDDDRAIDLAFGCMKWSQYAALRSAALVIGLFYMSVTTLLALRTYPWTVDAASTTTVLLLSVAVLVLTCAAGNTWLIVKRCNAQLLALRALCRATPRSVARCYRFPKNAVGDAPDRTSDCAVEVFEACCPGELTNARVSACVPWVWLDRAVELFAHGASLLVSRAAALLEREGACSHRRPNR